jgi:hypothetical protein
MVERSMLVFMRKSATRRFLEDVQKYGEEFWTSSMNSRGIRFCHRTALPLPRMLGGLDGLQFVVMMKAYRISSQP